MDHLIFIYILSFVNFCFALYYYFRLRFIRRQFDNYTNFLSSNSNTHNRTVVGSISDLKNIKFPYIGLSAFVFDERKLYFVQEDLTWSPEDDLKIKSWKPPFNGSIEIGQHNKV